MVADVLHQDRCRDQIVGRDVEEALGLHRVQVDGQHAIGAGGGDHVGDELGRDRGARGGLPVLPRITEIGDHCRHTPRRAALQRIEADEQLHQVVIRRIGGRLDHEDVLAAHVLVNLDEHLHVRKSPHARVGKRQVEIIRHRLGKGPIAVAGEDLHLSPTHIRAAGRTPTASHICNVTMRPLIRNLPA